MYKPKYLLRWCTCNTSEGLRVRNDRMFKLKILKQWLYEKKESKLSAYFFAVCPALSLVETISPIAVLFGKGRYGND